MLIYSIFMLVESTIMLNTMLTVVAIITKKPQYIFLADMWYTNGPLLIWAPTVTLSLAVTLSAIVKSSGQRSILDVLNVPQSCLSRKRRVENLKTYKKRRANPTVGMVG